MAVFPSSPIVKLTSLPFPSPSPSPPSSSSTATLVPLFKLYPILISNLFSQSCRPIPNRNPSSSSSCTQIYSRRASIEDNEDDDEAAAAGGSFEDAVEMFNMREYYECHDCLEAIWNKSQDPIRTLVHGILQCAVGFHHLFNQNHKGAMMELGEGLCKLRKMNLESGPFHEFEKEISAFQDFIYQTQLELAACTDDFCLTLDQSEKSYKLLGGYAAGKHIYCLESDANEILYVVFCPERASATREQPRVRLPLLHASEEHLLEFEYD